MARAVPRLARILDLIGLALTVGGAACYAYAWSGLESIRTGETVVTGRMFGTLNAANAYSLYSQFGIATAVAGIGVCVAAFFLARRARTGTSP